MKIHKLTNITVTQHPDGKKGYVCIKMQPPGEPVQYYEYPIEQLLSIGALFSTISRRLLQQQN